MNDMITTNQRANLPWSMEETIVAFNVYCKIPFKESSQFHPLIIEYAALLGRSAASLNMKVGNFGRLDPTLQAEGIVGLRHGSKIEEEVWQEFMTNPDEMAIKCEEIVDKLRHEQEITIDNNLLNKQPNEKEHKDTDKQRLNADEEILNNLPSGEEYTTTRKERMGQEFFRSAVLSSYNNHCCVSGIGNTELLDACHVLDWATNKENRTNPQNGLCLNVFFHRAYDKFLFAITPDYEIVISDKMIDNTEDERMRTSLIELKGKQITLPDRFLPKKEFLEEHYSSYIHNQ